MTIDRRKFLKVTASVAGATVVSQPARAIAKLTAVPARRDSAGVLVDTTKCIGCRSCEAACNEVNNLPKPEVDLYDPSVLESRRQTDSTSYTVVNAFLVLQDGSRVTVKSQCMHCQEPACASACFVKALEKTSMGPVVYHEDRCVGCRYCMVACPFSLAKFEYEKAVPAIKKCQFCFARQAAGKPPACVEACPAGALTFGKRHELIETARSRIYNNPDQYVHHIYGEHEVEGTSWMYISSVPFEDLGFRTDLGTTAYPTFTQGFLSAVPLVLIIWPAILTGCYWWSRNRDQHEGTDAERIEKEA